MDNKKKIVIAIDGFSSCGKSTFAKAIAAKLGYIFIDTGKEKEHALRQGFYAA
jgi:cytidylate kinase